MCCPAFRPRYKRLVDNIFPATNDGGLVRSEMEKLTYYAASAPEKLDRIGEYLAHRLTRSISRKRDASVFIAMEALDQLLLACHAQQINSFVESFLRMVANLLESDNPDFQAVGTNSFIKFSKIEEDNASYHRRYDFFVSKFSSMCHSNLENIKDRKRIQGHGIRGLHGVVRKTVPDELQANIWQKQHMDKIIPSLLYVMMQEQNPEQSSSRRGSLQNKEVGDNLTTAAEDCLRELLSRASYSNVGAALRPALAHLDNHKKWTPVNAFAIKCFKVFMYAIQTQYSHIIVKMLLDHLDEQDMNEGELKASILEVLCAVVSIPTSSPIGPAVIEVFSQLVRHLEYSTDSKNHDEQEVFQKAFINTIGVLCDVLPEYQKMEAMVLFITKGKEFIHKNDLQSRAYGDEKVEKLLGLTLRSLNRIASNCNSKDFSALSSSLLEPLIKVSSRASATNRLVTQEVLIRLLDRSKNFSVLVVPNSVSMVEKMNLKLTEAGPNDIDMIERKVPTLLQFVYESACFPDNVPENFVALFKCTSMICAGLASPDVITDICRVMLALQDAAFRRQLGPNDVELDARRRNLISNMVASCMCVLSFASGVTNFIQYVTNVMNNRLKDANRGHLDPCTVLSQTNIESVAPLADKPEEATLFSGQQIESALRDSAIYKTEKLAQPFVPAYTGEAESVQMKKSMVDAESVRVELGAPPEEEQDGEDEKLSAKMITFEFLKRKLMEPAPLPSELAAAKRKTAEHVMSASFEQLFSEMQARMPAVGHLSDLIERVCPPENEQHITMLPFTLPGECKPGSNNLVFPTIYAL